MMPMMLRKALMVGRTPGSARDALVPQPVQRYQHLAGCQQADGGVGRGPGVRPTKPAELAMVLSFSSSFLGGTPISTESKMETRTLRVPKSTPATMLM